MQYTLDPAGISNDVSDPLMTDDLSDPVTCKCSSVKKDQISDDEEGHVLNDCSDGASGKLMHQDSFDQPNTLAASQGEKVEAQSRGDIAAVLDATLIGAKKELSLEENAQIIKEEEAANDSAGSSAGTKECIRDAIEETSQFACSVQMTEIYIPVQDCQLPRANIVFNEKEGNEELLNEENYPAFISPNAVGTSSDAVDPLEVDDELMFTEVEKVIGNSEMTNDSMTEAIGLSTPDQVLVETTPTSHLLAERNVWNDLKDDCIGSSASVTHIQSKTVASPCGDRMNVMDKDLKEDIAHHADKGCQLLTKCW
ncbi:uncharacterized protein LOC124173144 [Ischnura elegans]|uniref:uncharacterized protein LOC124173144 n=1 Tax=Ischnura elegans TaxID=197161 RepID=UPI001ED8AD5C|nr:uncharacterized protein LOC124173144 [Ischnura elegans]